jgi:hypothetical protein
MLNIFYYLLILLSLSHCVVAFSPTVEITKANIQSGGLPRAHVETKKTKGAIEFRIKFFVPYAEVAKPQAYLTLTLNGKELGSVNLAESGIITGKQAERAAEAFMARFTLKSDIAKESKLWISYAVLDRNGIPTSSYESFAVILGTFIPEE